MHKLICICTLALGWFSCPLNAMDGNPPKAEPERIRMITIAHLEGALSVMDEEHEQNPHEKHCGISDWDMAIVGLSNIDMAGLLRQHNTLELFQSWKRRMPVFVSTARCHSNYTIEQYETYAKSMEEGSGIRVSDQDSFKDLVLDLRPQTKVDRGIFVRGIYYTGSRKGPLTCVLLDQPGMYQADHYFFVDDDMNYITQMMESFKERKEKLTVFYYPEIIEFDHSSYLSNLQNLTPMRSLSFYIRHAYKDLTIALLNDTSVVQKITQVNLGALFIDLTYCKCEETAEFVIRTLNLKPEMLTDFERTVLYQILQYGMDKHPQEFSWSKKYIETLKPK